MSLPIPLSVRLVTSKADRHITRDLRDLSFRSVVPGGFASARLPLDRPLRLQPDEIAHYGRVKIYDARNGQVVWEGRLEDPSMSTGPDGQVWELAAVGPSAHMRDSHSPFIWIDRQLDRWTADDRNRNNSRAEVTRTAANDAVIKLSATEGTTIAAPWRSSMVYDQLWRTGQVLARIHISGDHGFNSPLSWDYDVYTSVGFGAETVVGTDDIDGTSSDIVAVYSTNIPVGHNVVKFVMDRHSNSSVASDLVHIWGIVWGIRARLRDKAGTVKTTGYTNDYVLASEVVEDLLGFSWPGKAHGTVRLLNQFDGDNATVEATSYGITQCAYPDGVHPADVLEDLMVLEPGFYWAAWESGPAGKYRFEWVSWPTTVGYEASTVDGYTSTGSADGLFDAVTVRYRDLDGQVRTTQRSQSVQVLQDAGLGREGFLDLGDEIGSPANADRAGDQWLADHATAPNEGRLTIARPVLDRSLGKMVMPWELRPGKLIRLTDVLPSSAALSATTTNGVNVFRVVSVEFNASSASATLELDSYSPSVARALAQAGKIRKLRADLAERRRR